MEVGRCHRWRRTLAYASTADGHSHVVNVFVMNATLTEFYIFRHPHGYLEGIMKNKYLPSNCTTIAYHKASEWAHSLITCL